MLKKELFYCEVCETRDEYLTRAAKVLDNIHKGIIEMSASDLQQFKNVIGEVMMPVILDIATHCRVTGKINNIEDDFIQNLSMKIFLKLPDFNNSKTKEYGETYRFSTFVNLYVDDAIRLTRAKEKGYSPRMDRKRRMIAKAIAKAANDLNKKEEDVTVEEIFLFMPDVTKNPLTIKDIERTIDASKPMFYLDELDQAEDGVEDKIVIEEEAIKNDFRRFLDGFRPLQQYFFIQGIGFCADKYDDVHTKQLACDPKIVALCKEDAVGAGHIRRGAFRIDRLKMDNKYIDAATYDDIEYVEERFIRDEKGRMNNRFRKMVREGEYTEQEIIANLIPVLNEYKEEFAGKYGL